MSIIETYIQEIEAELDLVREKLVELKEKIRGLSDVERIQSLEKIEELETMDSDVRAKMEELNEDMAESWDQIKGDIDSSRERINDSFARLNRSLV